MRDFKRLRSDPPQGVNGSPNPDNIMQWNAVIFGPEDTPWDGGEGLQSKPLCFALRISRLCGWRMHAPPCRPAISNAPCTPHYMFVTGTFKLTLEFTEEYPNKAPVVKFKSQMFHPNSEPLFLALALP